MKVSCSTTKREKVEKIKKCLKNHYPEAMVSLQYRLCVRVLCRNFCSHDCPKQLHLNENYPRSDFCWKSLPYLVPSSLSPTQSHEGVEDSQSWNEEVRMFRMARYLPHKRKKFGRYTSEISIFITLSKEKIHIRIQTYIHIYIQSKDQLFKITILLKHPPLPNFTVM